MTETQEICQTIKTREQAFQWHKKCHPIARSYLKIPSKWLTCQHPMLDLPCLSRPLRRHVHKMLRKKTKAHGRRSRRLQRESNFLQSVGASSLQDGTMDYWSIVTPDTGSVWCVLSGFLVMPSLLLILYPGRLYNFIFDFYLCLSRRSPSFPRHFYCWPPSYRVSSWELLPMYTWRISLDLER